MAYETDKAVCLRVTDFSETSQIAAMFTQDHGLVPMIAKGAKRQGKSGAGAISGPLDLLAAGEVIFIPAKSGAELATLSSWQLTDQRNSLRRDLAALHGACIAADMTLALLRPLDPHRELLGELEATLALLATPQRGRALVAYAMTALEAAGYRPLLQTCAVCGAALAADKTHWFTPQAGGGQCAQCLEPRGEREGRTMSMSGRVAAALDRLPSPGELLANPPERPADPAALHMAMMLLVFHLETILGRRLRTGPLVATVFTAGSGR